MSAPVTHPQAATKTAYLPREHGATAMTLTPIVCAAILARAWHWAELATLVAAFAALSVKDPLTVLLRQRFVWKQPHPETPVAARWFAGYALLLATCGVVLPRVWPLRAVAAMGAGVAAYSALAIWVNVRNRQRSTLFQIVSALALTSSSLATSLSALRRVAPWCWWLWLMLAAQATTGILAVHARLDAKIALRKPGADDGKFRHAAFAAVAALGCGAVAMLALRHWWLAAALALAAVGYAFDLQRQRNADELQRPLMSVGRQALTLATLYAAMLVAGLW